jgi:hypothetical protein
MMMLVFVLPLLSVSSWSTAASAFQKLPFSMTSHRYSQASRRTVLSAGLFGGMFNGGSGSAPAHGKEVASTGSTNEVVKVVNGIKRRRLGGSDILVSEVGLGTQRWASSDFNGPSREACFEFMDAAILKGGGVNLIDTAEQYPIPSDGVDAREGDTEIVIGKWMKDRKVPRDDVVIATKITGGR